MPHSGLHADVEHYYTEKFKTHGATALGVDWNSEESQTTRFEQLARILPNPANSVSVNDLGCGYGAFAVFLDERWGFCGGSYCGYELSEVMVDHARRGFRHCSWARFELGSKLAIADYTVASGIFNVKLANSDDAWRAYVWDTLDQMARASRFGMAFNLLTLISDEDKRRPDLFYEDPSATLQTCLSRFGRHIALLHDYRLWEFTVLVRFP